MFILEIYSTTEFNFIACISTPERRLYFRCSHQAMGWEIKEMCFDSRQGQKTFLFFKALCRLWVPVQCVLEVPSSVPLTSI